ncbi:phosphoenolpyruvate carboxykinase (ATP) [Candidatus Enterococcus ferrettii]|uniref:phosphoenolpyruvate carboxykinase (ATP) n=1 Tax=Candidatus Enterococcus ferrettii TaxID=2815324 RepID=A0ABV0EPY4_9ENTE|nr:phosphoenolpyruvate carboxykinase (ATP) [Enterococcus sp. 665A]MBO1338933.1 phosphoenolpyruvate carboxykinase (ATP) [Enterococcus sp. 665A]
MSSIQHFKQTDITIANPIFSSTRTIIETAFYGNNVTTVSSLSEAYQLAQNSQDVVVTDLPVRHAEELGLPTDTKVLVSNDGEIVGRTAAARRIIGHSDIDQAYYDKILREAVFQIGAKECFKGSVFVGLDQEFSMQSHLMLPKKYAANLYTYLLNFQMAQESVSFYTNSEAIPEGDIYLLADPDWKHPDFPNGLVVVDSRHNCTAVLGLRYFGELKKASLTLAWATAHRNGFIACHGGMKQYCTANRNYTMAAFGLSGSGKSTITLAKHQNKYDIKVLHDDAFVISKAKGSTTALEPSYFDKTQDYTSSSEELSYVVTAQNVGITLNENGNKVLVTEDIRNGNGRSIKSRFATENRVDHLDEKIDGIFWIMKDDSLPPVMKVNDPCLAAVFGVTLATKRSTAENIVNAKADQLVIEPFANPFRSFPLAEDYQDFLELFQKKQTDCYMLNTGIFEGNDVTPQHTLSSIEKIVENTAEFKTFGPLKALSYLPIDGHVPPFEDANYIQKLIERFETRLSFIQRRKTINDGYDRLPNETEKQLIILLEELAAYKETLSN